MTEEKIKRTPFLDSGILLVDKPKEWTSHDVVNFIRRRFRAKKVGHCGTLDPAATGLLMIVIGKATKLSNKLMADNKEYITTILLGEERDSMDMEGEIIETSDTWKTLKDSEIVKVIDSFHGEQLQTPPMFSAKKIDGKKLYDLAREGKEVKREPVTINIPSIKLTRTELPEIDVTVECTKGTYIRVLGSDIGKKLGTVGVLKDLRRTRSGKFSVDNAFSIETIKTWEQEELADNILWLHNLPDILM